MTRCLRFHRFPLVALAFAAPLLAAPPARAQAEPFIGQMMITAATFCPRGWFEANGQLMQISQYQALFSLIGTQFGGDGRTTFALPDLRGRAAVHIGQGQTLSPVQQGQRGGAEQVTLSVTTLAPHTHAAQTTVDVTAELNASTATSSDTQPASNLVLGTGRPSRNYVAPPTDTTLDPAAVTASATATTAVQPTGGGQPVSIRSPFLGMRWCIALEGIFPSRN